MKNKSIDAVILAGGKGSRIKKFLKLNSKPMLIIKKKLTFLDYLLNNISKYNFRNIYILAGYRGHAIYKKYHNKEINFVKIKCIIEKKPMGTGGCLSLIKNAISENFVIFNGDTIFDIDINNFIKKNILKNKICIALKKNQNKVSGKLSSLDLKNKKIFYTNNYKYLNGGIYFFKKKIISRIQPKFISLENDILMPMIKEGKVNGQAFNDFFIDIGTPKDLKISKIILPKYFHRPAIFLDRDGTINYDKGYTHKFRDFKIIPGNIKALKEITKKKYYIFIITNQAGIGKGIFKIDEFYKLHNQIKSSFIEKGIFINHVEFCPFHPKAKIKTFRKHTNLRKPGNKMIKNILQRWDINLKKSIMIGDSIKDKKCAEKSVISFRYLNVNLSKTLKI